MVVWEKVTAGGSPTARPVTACGGTPQSRTGLLHDKGGPLVLLGSGEWRPAQSEGGAQAPCPFVCHSARLGRPRPPCTGGDRGTLAVPEGGLCATCDLLVTDTPTTAAPPHSCPRTAPSPKTLTQCSSTSLPLKQSGEGAYFAQTHSELIRALTARMRNSPRRR